MPPDKMPPGDANAQFLMTVSMLRLIARHVCPNALWIALSISALLA